MVGRSPQFDRAFDRSRQRNRQNHPQQTTHLSPRQQRQQHPNWIQPRKLPQQARSNRIFNNLIHQKGQQKHL